jgi:hypothetical protein
MHLYAPTIGCLQQFYLPGPKANANLPSPHNGKCSVTDIRLKYQHRFAQCAIRIREAGAGAVDEVVEPDAEWSGH